MRGGEGVCAGHSAPKDAVDDQALVGDAQGGELARRSGGLVEGRTRRGARPGPAPCGGVSEGAQRRAVELMLVGQTRQRADARGAESVGVDELAPRPRQGQQPQACGRSGRCRRSRGRRPRWPRESASKEVNSSKAAISTVHAAGELLFDAGHRGVGEHAPVGPDHPLAVGGGGCHRVDVHAPRARHAGNRRGASRPAAPEHLVEVGGRVGATRAAPAGPGRPSARAVADRRPRSCRRRPCR